jgi:hypothetical protein
LGKKDHADLPRGFHKDEGRNNSRIVTRSDERLFARTDLETEDEGQLHPEVPSGFN